jgi:hypothetical protein
MQQNKTFCDGCNAEIDTGFEVSNYGKRERGVSAYMERPAQFCSLSCLAMWSSKAKASAVSMEKTARSLHPHGTFHDENVPALAVA